MQLVKDAVFKYFNVHRNKLQLLLQRAAAAAAAAAAAKAAKEFQRSKQRALESSLLPGI